MKLQPFYRSPLGKPGFFEPISRREAAQIFRQWRQYENGSIRRMARRNGRARGYTFTDWWSGVDAALVLKADEAR